MEGVQIKRKVTLRRKVVNNIKEGDAGGDGALSALQAGNVLAFESFLEGVDDVFKRLDAG